MLTIARGHLTKAETVNVAAIESGVALLAEARDAVADFQDMVRRKAVAEFAP